jgi:hypothetical protein
VKTTTLADETKPEGRIYSLIGYIKRLVFEDPIMGLIAIIIIFPIGTAIATNAITGNADSLPLLIGALTAVVLCVLMPLIITKTWKMNQRQLAEQKAIAIADEGERRIIREEHKGKRFDELINAKIRSLEAQTRYILDKSASHEKQMLVDAIREVRDLFHKNEELAKVHSEFDSVLESLDRIEGQIGTRTEEGGPEIAVEDAVATDETDYRSLYNQKVIEVENLLDEIKGRVDNYEDLKAEGGRMQNELTRLATENEQLIKERHALEELIAVRDKMPKVEVLSEKVESKLQEAEEKPAVATTAELEKALKAVDGLEDEAPEDKEFGSMRTPRQKETLVYWNCPQCGRGNALDKTRCPKCGISKPQQLTNA